jgi:hypothetical protein
MTDDLMTPPRPPGDELDALLATAAGTPADDIRVADALRALAGQGRRARRAPVVAAAAIGAIALSLAGGAVAASVFGPWTYVPAPEYVVEHVWTTDDGVDEGTCRSHWRLASVAEQARGEVLEILNGIPVDELAPDPEALATLRERLESGGLDSWNWTDVHARQRALEFTIWDRVRAEVERRGLDPDLLIELNVETQCSVIGETP